MSWFERLLPSRIRTETKKKKDVPEGLWIKCQNCQAVLFRPELDRNLHVCPKCDHHHRLSARKRLAHFFDDQTQWLEIGEDVLPTDFLKFRDSQKYKDRITSAQKGTGEDEALIVVAGSCCNLSLVVAAFEFSFMGGSMGAAVGERFTQGVEYAITHDLPFICFSASGGARMQEGLMSLMQMAKTSAVIHKLQEKGLPYISILTDPTMGGVSASLAMLGDIILAEPNALVGFAGPRVIEQTVREILPEGFQRSEFLLEHGHIDRVVDRRALRETIVRLLLKLMNKPAYEGFNVPETEEESKG